MYVYFAVILGIGISLTLARIILGAYIINPCLLLQRYPVPVQ